jgi:hypothetical protein
VVAYTPDLRAETERVLNGGIPATEFDRVGAFKSRRSWSKYLKYCPLCVTEDIATFGETYWHRQHQLSEIFYCTKHQIRLVDSSITIKRVTTGFYPASSETNIYYDANAFDNLASYKDKLLKIGKESEWLINHGLEVDWAVNGYDKYWKLLRDKNLTTFRGRCDYSALESAFNDYWGKDFLDVLFFEIEDTRFKGWSHKVDKNKMRAYTPLYHILLMCFIAGSVSDFIKKTPADTP